MAKTWDLMKVLCDSQSEYMKTQANLQKECMADLIKRLKEHTNSINEVRFQ
jgi:hypothetical protein